MRVPTHAVCSEAMIDLQWRDVYIGEFPRNDCRTYRVWLNDLYVGEVEIGANPTMQTIDIVAPHGRGYYYMPSHAVVARCCVM